MFEITNHKLLKMKKIFTIFSLIICSLVYSQNLFWYNVLLEVDSKEVFISTGGLDFDNKKPSIILIHGSGLTHIVWSLHEQYYVSQGYNVLSIDLPGHGNSPPKEISSIESYGDFICEVVSELNLKNFHIC